ncbi:MAG: Hpt domain-containing protein [Pseudomonadales bacterium]|nr:Hpt domain-containing protein [Pseudomonadales bacterium]MBL4867347.1 Hpt domain-containing protein [Pseudomonadales bacterium]
MAVHLDMDALQELREVMEDEFGTLIATYLDDSVVRLESLKEALETHDADALRKAAHSFKGSCGNIGAPTLEDLCRQVEDIGRDGGVDEAGPLMDLIVSEYQEVKVMMEKML